MFFSPKILGLGGTGLAGTATVAYIGLSNTGTEGTKSMNLTYEWDNSRKIWTTRETSQEETEEDKKIEEKCGGWIWGDDDTPVNSSEKNKKQKNKTEYELCSKSITDSSENSK